MRVIVDTNVGARLFISPVDKELKPIWRSIDQGKSTLVAGGPLLVELNRIHDASRAIRTWERAGRAYIVGQELVEAEMQKIQELCISNDAHVIALARVSGTRLLCSEDQGLHRDFGNLELINNPPGRIYQNRSHQHLLPR